MSRHINTSVARIYRGQGGEAYGLTLPIIYCVPIFPMYAPAQTKNSPQIAPGLDDHGRGPLTSNTYGNHPGSRSNNIASYEALFGGPGAGWDHGIGGKITSARAASIAGFGRPPRVLENLAQSGGVLPIGGLGMVGRTAQPRPGGTPREFCAARCAEKEKK